MNVARSLRSSLLAALVLLLALPALAQEGSRKPAPKRGFFDVQLALAPDGVVYLLWSRPTSIGNRLFLSKRAEGTHFSDPVDVTGDRRAVASGFDELRPSIATAEDGRVAVAWADPQGMLLVALGEEHGRRFEAPLTLNQDGPREGRAFVSIAFDGRGNLHAVWIDPREAPAGQEEPAHLYHARIQRGRVIEQNLTAGHTASICGCCRPSIRRGAHGELVVEYRNVDADGYRDIHRITRDPAGHFGAPVRLGPPLWQLEACPMAGPVHSGGATVWRDGSTGRMRLVASLDPALDPERVLVADEAWAPTVSPRPVHRSGDGPPLILAPGRPHGVLMVRRDGQWQSVRDDLPPWCTEVAWLEGQILLAGEVEGQLMLEAHDVPGRN